MSQIQGLKGDPNDSPEKVFNDIVTQGWFLNNQKLVEQYIQKAPQCLRELIEWGIQIKFSDERAILTTGIEIMDALLKKARSVGVDLLQDVMLLDLLTHEGRVVGGLGLHVSSGDFILFRAKAVVMATGGWHKAFWPNAGMRDLSGEGVAMAHRAGADLGNMEFITFCCNVFLHPPIWRGSIAPYVLSVFAGGRLTNARGEEFLNRYDPYIVRVGTSTEWNKCLVSLATAEEVRAGRGTPHGGVYYSRGEVPWEEMEKACAMLFPKWKYKAMDLSEWGRKLRDNEPVEVGPAAEYFEGGIVVNERFETTLEGLYAAGECALGTFGANRVFSAITEMLVHGADAGAHAAEYANKAEAPEVDMDSVAALREKAEAPLHRPKGIRPSEVRRRVQEAAHKHLGPIRSGEQLRSFIEFLKSINQDVIPRLAATSKSRTYNKEWIDALELENMVQLLEIAAQSALVRTESRGVHYREDYPHTDNDNWLQESIVKRVSDGFRVITRPIIVTTTTPPRGVTPYLDFMKQMMALHSDTGGHH
jgi:succinate dehydrogenase/fumarate reductase flavoprotein subunit